MMEIEVALHALDEVGEGPVWDDRQSRLLRVDVPLCSVVSWDFASDTVEATTYANPVSAVIVRRHSDGWVVASGRDLILQDLTRRVIIATVDADRDGNRLNDCKCDPQGRIWAGTLSTEHEDQAGSLYRIDPDGAVERMHRETTISNGMGWSPAGDTMYFIDSATRSIDAFDFEAGRGRISSRRVFATIDDGAGLPDGMTVDADGGVWVCLFGGSAIRRYSPTGELDVNIRLPVSIPTCPVFGGPELDKLYITSSRRHVAPERRQSEELAGSIFSLVTSVRGLPTNRFDG